ncbi:MAG: galactose mutarotase [Anaerolineaceae bacterium]|nr:MAG: galactose mutarotase [Anaerolineaceae bacterium]
MKITQKSFGRTKSGEDATLYTVTNNNGMKISFTDFGANIVSIIVPDREGNMADVALGYKNLLGYENNSPGFGSFIGRNANRIEGARFDLNGKTYTLDKNEGENNLHGGTPSYNTVMYEAEVYEEEDMISLEFSRLSPNLEQGFPGNLDITITYSLTENNELLIEYHAVSDKDTVVNLTNHSYFNLSGHNSGSILDHKLWINSDQFTPTRDDLIPTGEIRDVEGTPMDFRKLKRIGDNINDDYEPLKQAGGYDHNYVLNTSRDEVEKVVELVDESTGRVMEVFTDKPGLQFYSANMLTPVENGKDGAVYGKYCGVCFETQHFPNACNIKSFPSSVLMAGQGYEFVTIYKFLCK